MPVFKGAGIAVAMGPFLHPIAIDLVDTSEYEGSPEQTGGRPPKHSVEELLKCLGDQRLTTTEWSKLARTRHGVTNGSFFALLKQLEDGKKVVKSVVDEKWELLQNHSKTSDPQKQQ